MVNFWPIRPDGLERATDNEREIGNGPIFKLGVLQRWLTPQRIHAITGRCVAHLDQLRWDAGDVCGALKYLAKNHYRKSVWCRAGKLWLPCDDYVLRSYNDGMMRTVRPDIYLKFSVADSGQMLYLVSCHDS